VGRLPVMDLDLTGYPLLLNALQLYMGKTTGSRMWGPDLTTAEATLTCQCLQMHMHTCGSAASCREGALPPFSEHLSTF
jgi:hypothetical protein